MFTNIKTIITRNTHPPTHIILVISIKKKFTQNYYEIKSHVLRR